MEHLLEADSILHAYDNKRILSDIYMRCQTNEIVGLLGRNGSGKSTLLQVIFGTLSAENSSVRVNGKYYKHLYLAKGMACYLPQNTFLPQGRSLGQVARMFLPEQRQRELLFQDELLGKLYHSRVYELSGGERRYFELLLLLQLRPRFLLLDEPFSGIDPLYREKIELTLQEARKTSGIILTDHYYRHVLNISTRLVLLQDQRTIHLQGKEELKAYEYLPGGIV